MNKMKNLILKVTPELIDKIIEEDSFFYGQSSIIETYNRTCNITNQMMWELASVLLIDNE